MARTYPEASALFRAPCGERLVQPVCISEIDETLPAADRLWHQAAADTLRGTSVRLLGFHVATPGGVEELPRPLGATA